MPVAAHFQQKESMDFVPLDNLEDTPTPTPTLTSTPVPSTPPPQPLNDHVTNYNNEVAGQSFSDLDTVAVESGNTSPLIISSTHSRLLLTRTWI